MKLWRRTIELGITNLMLHKLRSLLTAIGVVLGVASVIIMLAIGEGSRSEALAQIRRLGANNIIIRSVKPRGNEERQSSSFALEYGLRYRDFDRVVGAIPTIDSAVPSSLAEADAQRTNRKIDAAQIVGTTPEFLKVKGLRLRRGRFLTATDVQACINVVVLSDGAAQRLFSFTDPIGKSLLIGTGGYRVVGVLAPKGPTSATSHLDTGNELYIPLSAARQQFGELKVVYHAGSLSSERTQLNEITLTVLETDMVRQTATMVRAILSKSHPEANDYEIQVPLELLRQAEEEKRIWNIVLGSVASISLLVGGIGIMNIMLANITERTREIGIRRALGARRKDIAVQFLVETSVLSSIGGLLGIVLGVSLPWAIGHYSGITAIVQWWSVVLAMLVSIAVGIIFGSYPASRAARMQPIEALRHE